MFPFPTGEGALLRQGVRLFRKTKNCTEPETRRIPNLEMAQGLREPLLDIHKPLQLNSQTQQSLYRGGRNAEQFEQTRTSGLREERPGFYSWPMICSVTLDKSYSLFVPLGLFFNLSHGDDRMYLLPRQYWDACH